MPKKIKPKGIMLSDRKKNVRELRKKFIIVCEGERTEPNYFRQFRVPKEVIDIIGVGANTVVVVQRAIEEKQKYPSAEVWSVFDRDSFPAQNFNNALALAKQHGIKVGYSNEAFEIWYLLHFHYHDVATSRDLYETMLSDKKRLGFKYRKNDPNMYHILENKQNEAIRNAERLLQLCLPHNPERDNPCTTIHHLVQALNEVAV
ncbi:MAG: RloB domain-containing protein [Anaerolineales bacterium]|nr:RloB domain-containing protein [Anaerolineales bacterium]